ncbi:sigma-70 family RNA polymerase sigma factor [Candidatus Kuenenia sp.]|uniref:sigma-70 family RNA polymerase sigma factor n=1 Tax=Candidatus Kuenenia sp. TaxID=2499824 RepID=UPI003220268F
MPESVNPQTLHLVMLAKSGDQPAIEKLYEIYSGRILRIVRMRMGNELRSKMQSMDLVQDVLLSSFRDLKQFTYKNEGDFLRWLSHIAENRIRDKIGEMRAQVRDHRREQPLSSNKQLKDDSSVHTYEPMDSATPSKILSKEEDLDKLEKAMQKLKPKYREVILLTKAEGLSQKQVGEKLGKSPDATRMLLVRALNALNNAFGENR